MQQIINPAITYMLTHYTEPVTVEELCQCCYISPSHLRRGFLAAAGIPPMAFLHKIRIRHACAALEGSDDSILSIATRCGYTTLSSFNRQFQKIMHMTPSQYREKHTGR